MWNELLNKDVYYSLDGQFFEMGRVAKIQNNIIVIQKLEPLFTNSISMASLVCSGSLEIVDQTKIKQMVEITE